MYIHKITHENSLVEKKCRFFSDYFVFTVHNLGLWTNIQVENHQSIFENIKYILESQRVNPSNYFDLFIKNKIITDSKFSSGNKILNIFKTQIKPYIKLDNVEEKNHWLKSNRSQLNLIVNRYLNRIKHILFKEYVYTIISYLTCLHDLEEHKESIKNTTKLIVSDLLLNGFTHTDILEIFDYIYTKDPKKFPFKRELMFKSKFNFEIKKEEIENRDLKGQFEGIINFRLRPIEHSYVALKIYGLEVNNECDFIFDNYKLVSYDSKLLAKTRNNNDIGLKYYFENNRNYAIFIIKQSYRSEKLAIFESILEAKSFVKKLNLIPGFNCLVDIDDIILTKDFKDFRVSAQLEEFPKTKLFSHNDYDVLNHDTIGVQLSKNYINFIELSNLEYIYIEAISENAIYKYWQYLESVCKIKYSNNIVNNTIEFVAKVLAIGYKINVTEQAEVYIYNCLINNSTFLGFEYSKIADLNYDDVLKIKFENEILNDISVSVFAMNSEESVSTIYEFYCNQLTKLYMYRNSIIHSSYIINNIKISLQYLLQKSIFTFRKILFENANLNTGTPITNLFQIIENNYNCLLKQNPS